MSPASPVVVPCSKKEQVLDSVTRRARFRTPKVAVPVRLQIRAKLVVLLSSVMARPSLYTTSSVVKIGVVTLGKTVIQRPSPSERSSVTVKRTEAPMPSKVVVRSPFRVRVALDVDIHSPTLSSPTALASNVFHKR